MAEKFMSINRDRRIERVVVQRIRQGQSGRQGSATCRAWRDRVRPDMRAPPTLFDFAVPATNTSGRWTSPPGYRPYAG